MALVSSSLANLVGGVSQQPPALRLPTSATSLENAWPSIVSGNQKRPATLHVASVPLTIVGNVGGYLIDRDPTYRYITLVTNGDLKVIDTNTGSTQTITFPDGKAYLTATSPVDSFRFMTLGDYTFIVNRNIVAGSYDLAEPIAGLNRRDPTHMGTVYVTASAANTYYTVYINGSIKASVLTHNGIDASNKVEDSGVIAGLLQDQLISNGYTVEKTGSTLTITNLAVGDKIVTQGGSGDKSLKAFVDAAQSFSDLPPSSPQGRIVRIAGAPETQGDDYYVIFNSGVWTECVGYGEGVELDPATMPHVLVRNGDGTWTFKEHSWTQRTAGDTESNKLPSFVGFKINDIFLYTNRMGLLADENVILSESGIYENFFRTTVAQLLESDRIDVAVLNNGVQVLNHAVPFNRDLLLVSETAQFRLSYINYLGPKTIQIKFTTAFNVSKRVKPINMGNSIYMVDDRPDYDYMKIWEFFPKDLNISDDAEDVTAPVPEYIKNDAAFFGGSNRAKVAVLSTASDPATLYFYKFYWSADKKIQSSWHKWTFNDCVKIHWGAFSGLFFYVLIQRSDGLKLERIKFDEDVFNTNTDYEILLDRRASPLSTSYSSVTKKTTIVLPYSTTADIEVVSTDTTTLGDNVFGYRHNVTKVSNNTVTVDDDITPHTITVGIPYTWSFEFSPMFQRIAKGQGEVVSLDGRIQLRYITVEYHNTAYFQVHTSLPGRDVMVTDFNGRIVGGDSAVLGQQSFASGKYRIPVMGSNYQAKVWLTNDSPFPSAFGSAEWQGIISPKSVARV